jgi:hypothetical protein
MNPTPDTDEQLPVRLLTFPELKPRKGIAFNAAIRRPARARGPVPDARSNRAQLGRVARA